MLKLTVAVLAAALGATANADRWRSLRVDGSGDEAFAHSLEVFQDKLSPARRYVFGEALKDIWIQGEKTAEAEQREYTAEDYYAQVDGLGYDEIVTFTDSTGETAKRRYKAGRVLNYRRSYAPPSSIQSDMRRSSPWEGVPPPPSTWQPRDKTDLFGSGQK